MGSVERNIVIVLDRITQNLPSAFALGASAGGLLCLAGISIIGDAKDAPHILQLIGFLVKFGLMAMRWFGFLFVVSYLTKVLNQIRGRKRPNSIGFATVFSIPLSFIFLITCYVSFDGIGYFSQYVTDVLVCDAEMKAFNSPDYKDSNVACLDNVKVSKESMSSWSNDLATVPRWVGWGLIGYLFGLLVIVFVSGEKDQGNGDAPMTGA